MTNFPEYEKPSLLVEVPTLTSDGIRDCIITEKEFKDLQILRVENAKLHNELGKEKTERLNLFIKIGYERIIQNHTKEQNKKLRETIELKDKEVDQLRQQLAEAVKLLQVELDSGKHCHTDDSNCESCEHLSKETDEYGNKPCLFHKHIEQFLSSVEQKGLVLKD